MHAPSSVHSASTKEPHPLDDVAAFLRRHVVFQSDAQVIACSLWVAHTHAMEAADNTPYLHICSPEKRSGKSRLLDALSVLVARPWPAVNLTEAVIFRKIQADSPTLLLDEVDAIFKGNPRHHEGLRGLLNAGFQRGRSVPRCVGDGAKMQVTDFEVFCAKAIAGIGELPDTVADRSIRIELARRAPGESTSRFRRREREEADPLRELLYFWTQSVLADLKDAVPEIADDLGLDDRAADAWEPLLAIADAAHGEWPSQARNAAALLSGHREDRDDSQGIQLLRDIRGIFLSATADRLSTESLITSLVEIETSPWAEWWARDVSLGNVKGIGAKLARKLKPYSIKPKDLRFDPGVVKKGYLRADFEREWQRYLSPIPAREGNNATIEVGDDLGWA